MRPDPVGLFITFEGVDGSGKTTQLRLLAERLRSSGRTVTETAEPGGSRVGAAIRGVLLDGANDDLTPEAELLLYCASRAQNVAEVIRPALLSGHIVLSDRFSDSTFAYQGCGRGLRRADVEYLGGFASGGLTPDVTVLLAMDVKASLSRVREPDRMDSETLDFHMRVDAGYRQLAALFPDRIRVVDAGRTREAVSEDIWQMVSARV